MFNDAQRATMQATKPSSSRTPGPWVANQPDDAEAVDILQASTKQFIAEELIPADAVFIVRACNAHDDLVILVRRLAHALRGVNPNNVAAGNLADKALNYLVRSGFHGSPLRIEDSAALARIERSKS
jgi:hypothetical protein